MSKTELIIFPLTSILDFLTFLFFPVESLFFLYSWFLLNGNRWKYNECSSVLFFLKKTTKLLLLHPIFCIASQTCRCDHGIPCLKLSLCPDQGTLYCTCIQAKKKKVSYNILLRLHVFFLSYASIFFCAVLSHCHFPQRLLQLFTTLSYLCSYTQETPLPLSSPKTQSDQVGITSPNSSPLSTHTTILSASSLTSFLPIPETVSQSLISN